METQERVFLQDQKVTITQSRFIVNGKTFAMGNISSVGLVKIEPSNGFAIVLGILGLFICFAGGYAILAGLVMVAISVLSIVFNQPDYAVRINSNSGETNAIQGVNEAYIKSIVDAINEAIIYRG